MPTSRTTFTLSEPSGTCKIPLSTFSYLQERNKNLFYELVVGEFIKTGLTQIDLAARMGQKPARICRLLGAPGNWTLDTVSDLLFAICGAAPNCSVDYFLRNPPVNQREPEWVSIMANPKSQLTITGASLPQQEIIVRKPQAQEPSVTVYGTSTHAYGESP
jgi:hypothetical protein